MSQAPHYPVVTPYLIVRHAAELIQFMEHVFGATVRSRQTREESDKIRHAEVEIGTGLIMVAEATDHYPEAPAILYLYLEEVDSYYQKAIDSTATSLEEPGNQPYGHRRAAFADAHGNQWWLASPIQAK